MDYCELKEQIEMIDGGRRTELKRLLSLASLGGAVLPEFQRHLAEATTYREFFDALYADDGLRFEKAWALWAAIDHKEWVGRFPAETSVRGVRFLGRGLPVELGGTTMLVPTRGAGKMADVHVFADGAFNEDAAEFFASVRGSLTCAGLSLDGTFDIYRTGRHILFERWSFNEKGHRLKAAALACKYRRTS